jgi:hypothetical protein
MNPLAVEFAWYEKGTVAFLNRPACDTSRCGAKMAKYVPGLKVKGKY